LDEKRKEWQRRVYQRSRDRKEEADALGRQAVEWRAEGTHFAGRALIAGYRAYRTGWAPFTRTSAEAPEPGPLDEILWAECHRPVLRRSVWVGPTMHVTVIVLCAGVLNRPDWYLWPAVSIGNVWMVATLAVQRRDSRRETDSV